LDHVSSTSRLEILKWHTFFVFEATMITSTPQKVVGILIFANVEVLDFCGPFEVFSVTRPQTGDTTKSPFQVLLVAEDTEAVTTIGGMQVLPHVSFKDCPYLDILVVPGGKGTRTEMNRPTMLDFVQKQAKTVELMTSVCTGSLILGKAGLLDGKRATTHWDALEELEDCCPNCMVDRASHWVRDGQTFTSAGISAGIDMALKLVEECCSEDVARASAKRMEYPYPESNVRRIQI
jgi:transcriptional regulator GlxA family with amidase domain